MSARAVVQSFRARIAVLLVLATVVITAPVARAQEVTGLDGPKGSEPQKAATRPLSVALASALAQNVPLRELGAVDEIALREEDQAQAASGSKLHRRGIGRELTVRLADGRWDEVDGRGWLWRADVMSKGAKAVRLHFDAAVMPEGASLLVYSIETPEHVSGPYEGRGPLGDGQFWTMALQGERVRVEYLVPGDAKHPPTEPAFLVDRLAHVYRHPFERDGVEPQEGSCHNDVTCFPAWVNVARATAALEYIAGNGVFDCTGELLNNFAADLTPYLLTANHCISDFQTAQSTVVYWRWQTSTCNGPLPPISSLPTSAVCLLLAHGTSSDYSLLMVEGAIPATLVSWVGWTATVAGDGTAVSAVHHPGGAFKRISFGTKASSPGTCTDGGGPSGHLRANWSSGVTEPGSSGSGLYRNDTQQLIGQLHCGPSSCTAVPADKWDSYGAFASTYPSISSFLAGGTDDNSEPNNTCATARLMTTALYSGLIVKSVNDDWYEISVPANRRLTVTLNFTNPFGDIDCELYGACGGSPLATSTGITGTEKLDYFNTGPAQSFRVRVYLFSDTRNTYSMGITVNPFPNLDATLIPFGYSSPAVPRNLGDATPVNVTLTPTLNGNTNDTWLNWAIYNHGPGITPQGWESELRLDEDVPAWSMSVPPGNDAGLYWSVNAGPTVVRGGRHSLTSVADVDGALQEPNEADNVWRGQWVWSPYALTRETPLLRLQPPRPDWSYFTNPNSDGFQFTRPTNYAWVVSESPANVNDDYDLHCYSDYSGSTSGFSTEIGASVASNNFTDFVVGHFASTPTVIYHGVIEYSTAGGGGRFAQDQSDAQFRNAAGGYALWQGQVLPSQRLADVYEALLQSGVTYQMLLTRTAGTPTLGFEVFPGSAGGIYGRGGGTTAAPLGPGQSALSFTPSGSGWHPIVVYRDRGNETGSVTYTLEWGNTVGVSESVENSTLRFLGARPNPVADRASFAFSLSRPGRARLELYDLGGRRVRALIDERLDAGSHTVTWDRRADSGSPVGAGIFWARFEAEGHAFTQRVVLLR